MEDNNKEILSISKWFYDETKETFYSANRLMKILKIKRENLYSYIVKNMPQCKIDINNMIIFDYVLNNTDRHMKNFGFLMMDEKIKMAPLYDNGLCLGSDIDDDIIESEDMEDLLMDCDYSKCFESSNQKQLILVDEFTANLDIDFEPVILKYREYLKPKRIEFILKLIKKRIEEVKNVFPKI